ncbi:FYVE and coiled-coil domain-containing protein 1 [Hypomesus transpacificus]|uniref:FYVE and coiled-coil domain-containing protein 1 n=1 Tax=Hypomesus transpacificus TaxID=137520 RepID=UPI001F07D030|nr:FYVE and coiled-coil domain-containing protein 1 [Hypomesus transpacificus]XP_046905512.1 FYVE and coiled-coil domain-containing protein 1 [Hypomesus transpacificus]
MATVGESQLQRIIRDLHDAVTELTKEYRENGEPITDDSSNLHKLSYKLEYLLQFDLKEKTTFMGTRKDYWEYFSDCLAKIKGANDGIRFVKSIPELKTSLGKGRAFIRYSLVHQRLADTLQQCLMNQRVTSDWFYARSPFLKPHLSVDIISHLYELNEVQFDVASRGHDLDSSWPTFARRTLGLPNSPSHTWKAPSRSSSINSLASTYSQQAHEFPSSPDYGTGMLSELNESLPACGADVSAVDDLRLELDQSELKQRELLERVQQLGEEGAELRGVVVELQRQLDVSLAAQGEQAGLQRALRTLEGREEALEKELEGLRMAERARATEQRLLQEKMLVAEGKNAELMAKLDGVLDEKGQQAASYFDSAQKIHELLDKLKEADKGKMDAVVEGEERRRHAERLAEELRGQETAAKEAETKRAALALSSAEQKAKLKEQAKDQLNAIENLQGALSVREKEASNLQRQLQDLQRALEEKERLAEEIRRRSEDEKEETQKSAAEVKESQERELLSLRKKLRNTEAELASSTGRLQESEAQNQSLTAEREGLSGSLSEAEAAHRDQAKKTEDYKTQCTNLMELNGKLLSAAKRNEELKKELAENRAALEAEVAALRASDKQLRSQLDDAKVTVDEKERRLREENRALDESLQRAAMAAGVSDKNAKRLEKENVSLREEQATVKVALGSMQEELRAIHGQIGELEKSLGVSRRSEAGLQERLRDREAQLENKKKDCAELQARMEDLEARERELEKAKAQAEDTCARQTELIQRVTSQTQAVEKAQLERSSAQAKESQEAASRLTLVESQLEVNVKEVSRLQGEVLDLRVQLQKSGEERVKTEAQLQVTEAQRDELRTLTEQLKVQTEALNQEHVAELLQCREREEALARERDRDKAAHAELAALEASGREQLATLKAQNERLELESTETKEGLHRANTEMAELGMTICRLTAEKEEAREHWEGGATEMEMLKEKTTREGERLEACLAALRQENLSLNEELKQTENLPATMLELQEKLEKAEGQVKMLEDSGREEMEAVKFQMSSESMNSQNQIKNVNEELRNARAQLQTEKQKVSSLEAKVSELESVNVEYFRLIGEKDAHATRSEASLRQSDEEIQRLKYSVASTEEVLSDAQKVRDELQLKLDRAEASNQNQNLTMAAEIDDLCRTKSYLEERLIELIKDKDALWQKSDALEFEQKQRAEERWWLVDKEATHCLGCQGHFTWWLRRHHCRLCGRIFCYYCSNNFVTTKHSGKKERCCRECYTQHSAVVERFTQAELSPSETLPPPLEADPQDHPQPAPYKPTPRVTVLDPKSDDGAYDIITEEDVNGVYDSDTMSQTTGGSLEGEQEAKPPGALDIGTGDLTPDDPEENVPTVQDAEINLLKCGELTLVVPLGLADVTQFGDGSRELFVKSSCYSVVAIAVDNPGPTIKWVFSSEPKSISFSVVYRDTADSKVEQSKVLIPLTRCNSHKETIQGQLKVRNPGLYTLIFDNSFSRFISKKVLYHLTIEEPVIYDGSDFP